jgi:hypothetical protein
MIVDWRALTLGVKGRNWVEALCKDAADEAGMRTNRLRATLKAGEIALGTIVWGHSRTRRDAYSRCSRHGFCLDLH